jgi:VTC domain
MFSANSGMHIRQGSMPIFRSLYRNELKYSMSESRAHGILHRIRPFMRADDHGETYTVSSLYLDSSSLMLLNDADVGKLNRHKVRIRTYSRTPGRTVYLEIKERRNRMIRKHRVPVRTDRLATSLAGRCCGGELLVNPDSSEDNRSLDLFMMRCREIDARPVSMVRYERSAYMGLFQPELRLTFDRCISTYPVTEIGENAWSRPNIERALNPGQVVMEIKGGGKLPDWMTCIIREFDLYQRSFSKYVLCTKLLQAEGAVALESAI